MKLLLTLALLSVTAAVPSPRDQKVLSLFSVVNFDNVECQPTDASLKAITGTCFSSTECTNKGGKASGKCASGFGACCTFTLAVKTSGTVSQNLTVVQNEKYPTALTTAAHTTTYTIKPVTADICMLRFDFIAFDLEVDAVTSKGACLDSLTITSPSGKNPPKICGKNAGYHLYSDVGRSATSSTAVITTGSSTTHNRSWRIKITQIECNSPSKPPTGCAQYYTAASGGFESFNFLSGALTQGLDYNICFRKNPGMCKITFTVDQGSTTPAPFNLQAVATTALAAAKVTTGNCDSSRIVANAEVYCGTSLNEIDAKTVSGSVSSKMFMLGVWSPSAVDLRTSTGFKLMYTTSSVNC